MKRNGFTIAEALITMAIVGIVAALTIPTFITDYRKQVDAKSLATAVSNFETAMGTMIMKEGVYNLYETSAWEVLGGTPLGEASTETVEKYVARIGTVLKDAEHCEIMDVYDNTEGVAPIKSVTGGTPSSYFENFESPMAISATDFVGIRSKNNIYWIYINNAKGISSAETTEGKMLAYGSQLSSVSAVIIIDVNGRQKPNMVARDLFMFFMSDIGTLYPVGGTDVEVFQEALHGISIKRWDNVNSQFKCRDRNISSPGWGCTARLIENGYKMDY